MDATRERRRTNERSIHLARGQNLIWPVIVLLRINTHMYTYYFALKRNRVAIENAREHVPRVFIVFGLARQLWYGQERARRPENKRLARVSVSSSRRGISRFSPHTHPIPYNFKRFKTEIVDFCSRYTVSGRGIKQHLRINPLVNERVKRVPSSFCREYANERYISTIL